MQKKLDAYTKVTELLLLSLFDFISKVYKYIVCVFVQHFSHFIYFKQKKNHCKHAKFVWLRQKFPSRTNPLFVVRTGFVGTGHVTWVVHTLIGTGSNHLALYQFSTIKHIKNAGSRRFNIIMFYSPLSWNFY